MNNLEKFVSNWINEKAEDYDGDVGGVLRDLFYGGCQSGYVGELVYYTDTVAFYREHQRDIDRLLYELCEECDLTPAGLFGDNWDSEDPLARDTMNQNLLAWFGFEETARRLHPEH